MIKRWGLFLLSFLRPRETILCLRYAKPYIVEKERYGHRGLLVRERDVDLTGRIKLHDEGRMEKSFAVLADTQKDIFGTEYWEAIEKDIIKELRFCGINAGEIDCSFLGVV